MTNEPGQNEWAQVPFAFKVQWPYNLQESERYSVSDGIYHLWVKNTDEPFNPPPYKHKTLPRTEQRFYLDGTQEYTSGQWEYEADMMVPAGSNGMSIMQIHTGNKDEATYGSTAFMLFWYDTDGGSLHHYFDPAPLSPLTTNLAGTWFQLKVRHDLNTHRVTVWFKSKQGWTEVWTGPQQGKSKGAKSYYMKDGVYAQKAKPPLKGASPLMKVYIKNIQFRKHS